MPIDIRKKEGETLGSFLFRFNKKVKQSGILKDVKRRRFRARGENRLKRRLGALYRAGKNQELAQSKKHGFGSSEKNK